jgi:uncharacterized protein YkwD
MIPSAGIATPIRTPDLMVVRSQGGVVAGRRHRTTAWGVAPVLSLTLLLLAALVVAWGGRGATAAVTPDVGSLRSVVLSEANAWRDLVGEAPLRASSILDTSAQAHAEYLVGNGGLWQSDPTFGAHTESPTLPGFYAVTVGDRARKAGYPHDRLMEDVTRLWTPGSALDYSPWDGEELVSGWVDAPLHRRALLDRSLIDAGFGYAALGEYHAYVLDTAQDHLAAEKPSEVQPYPARGQTDVPTSWDGNETPQPFPGLSYPSGYPITVFPVWGGSSFVTAYLELKRLPDGWPVPVVRSTVRNYAFAPVDPLDPGTSYRATFSYTMRNAYTGAETSGGTLWEFTTGGTSPTTEPPPTTSSSGTTLPTTTTSLPPTTTTLPSTTTTTLPTATFADVPASHPYYEAIEAMADAGVIAGYVEPGGARTFRAEEPVKRAQFAKMIVGGLRLPVGEGALVCPFSDVPKVASDLYPDDYVATAAARGITRGLTAELFGPWESIKRAQVITMVVRAAAVEMPWRVPSPPPVFVGELPSGDPTHGASLRRAESNGLLGGIPLEGWDVWKPAGRGEVAQILANLLD